MSHSLKKKEEEEEEEVRYQYTQKMENGPKNSARPIQIFTISKYNFLKFELIVALRNELKM